MATNETKRTPAITAAVNGLSLMLAFSDGRSLVINTDELDPAIKHYAMLHGLKQKLVDAAAISRNPETGRSATLDDKYDAVREVYNRLFEGQWNATRGDGTGSGGLLFKALCALYPTKSAEDVRAYHDKLTKAEQAALRANSKVAPIIAKLREEGESKAAKTVDSDALLSGLEG